MPPKASRRLRIQSSKRRGIQINPKPLMGVQIHKRIRTRKGRRKPNEPISTSDGIHKYIA